jgi:hypothetical protein
MKQGSIAHRQEAEKGKLIFWLGKEYVCTICIKCIIYVIGTNRRRNESLFKGLVELFLFPKLLNRFLYFFMRGYIKRRETHFSSINLVVINMNVISYDGKMDFYNFEKEFIAQIFYYSKYINI